MTQHGGGTIVFKGAVDEAATVAIAGKPAVVKPDNTFHAPVVLTAGTNRVTITATDMSGNTATAQYDVDVTGTSKSFTYDANGNMTGDGTRTFEWDAGNRLLRVLQGGHELSAFTYGAGGDRARATASGLTTRYVLDRGFVVEERRDGDVTIRHHHGPGVDNPLATSGNPAGTQYYAVDHLGSIRQHTDDSGALIFSREYDPWGNLVVGDASGTWAFTGREWDVEGRLYYYRARYYDSALGRFLSEDPLRANRPDRPLPSNWSADRPSATNLYAYANSNPVLFTDPAGTSPLSGAWEALKTIRRWTFPYRMYKLYTCAVQHRQCIRDVAAKCCRLYGGGGSRQIGLLTFNESTCNSVGGSCCVDNYLQCLMPFHILGSPNWHCPE